MAIPIIPIIMAVTALASGVSKAVSSVKDAKAQARATKAEAEQQIQEKARQAAKLMSQQKSSFLKGGVYFEGSPEDVINETYDFANEDIQRLTSNANTSIKNTMRKGRTAFATSLMDAVVGGLSGFAGGMQVSGGGNNFAGGSSTNGEGIMDKLRDVFGRKTNLTGGFGSVDGTNDKIA